MHYSKVSLQPDHRINIYITHWCEIGSGFSCGMLHTFLPFLQCKISLVKVKKSPLEGHVMLNFQNFVFFFFVFLPIVWAGDIHTLSLWHTQYTHQARLYIYWTVFAMTLLFCFVFSCYLFNVLNIVNSKICIFVWNDVPPPNHIQNMTFIRAVWFLSLWTCTSWSQLPWSMYTMPVW